MDSIHKVSRFLLVLFLLGHAGFAQVIPAGNSTTPRFEPSWNPGPLRRGTLSIMSSCTLSLILCVWTTVYLNIETWRKGGHQRFIWSAISLLFPEIVLCVAAHERKSAHLLQEEMVKTHFGKYEHWDLTLAYYAVMGGFVVERMGNEIEERRKSAIKASEKKNPVISIKRETSNIDEQDIGTYTESEKPTPSESYLPPEFGTSTLPQRSRYTLTPRGVLRLAELGVIPKHYTSDMVQDKSKASFLTNLTLFFQVIWIFIQVAGRYVSGLPVTLLELYTAIHTICAVVRHIIWMDKPFDINEPTILPTHYLVLEELVKSDNSPHNPINVFWNHNYSECLTPHASLGMLLFRQVFDWDESKRVTSLTDNFHLLVGAYVALWNGWQKFWKEACILSFVGLGYGGLHLAAWKYEFPSNIECVLWKVASFLTAVSVFCFCASSLTIYIVILTWKKAVDRKKWEGLAKKLEASVPQSAAFLCIMFILATFPYIVARLYLLVEAFVGMRKLPVRSYDVVPWGNYIPHFG